MNTTLLLPDALGVTVSAMPHGQPEKWTSERTSSDSLLKVVHELSKRLLYHTLDGVLDRIS